MPNWTPQQQQAIDARNNTILVSAAAGSGKTAVLVERIVQLIREGWRLDRMLIVTFTKAAAAEMRQRLSKRLVREAQSDPERMGQALDDLESTEISTIHAFCQKVLRNNFQAVGIDPMVRACDDQQRKLLFESAWLEAFNALLDERSDVEFMEMAYAWDQPQLMEMTGQLYDFLMSMPEPFDWLERALTWVQIKPYEQHPWYKMLAREAAISLQGMSSILQSMREMLDEPDAVAIRRETYEADCAVYARICEVDFEDPQDILRTLSGIKMARAKSARNLSEAEDVWLERFSDVRKRLTKTIKDVTESLTIDEEKLELEFGMMYRHLKGLRVLAERTHACFLAQKAEQHVIDFSDMEQFTMQVLSDPALRAQMQSEYDHIFVDECQDVSQIQDAILQAIHYEGNCMFMVGDVKQSIYRFRKADPTIFMHRLWTFSDAEDAHNRRILLQKNFRSCGNVLDVTNRIFRTVMRPDVTELPYNPEDELICGRETTDDPPVEMHLLDMTPGEDGEDVEALEAEARVVVERVQSLLNEEFSDGGEMRHYTYRDMVILLSAASNTAPKLVELLGRAGIPVYYDGNAAYFDLPEVRAVKSLLTVIDNPMQDISLLAALKMPPFSFTDAQIASIRTAKTGRDVPFYEAFEACCALEGPFPAKCQAAMKQLTEWRFLAENIRLSDFVWQVMQESGYYAAVGALPKGELRQANLRMLFQRALDYEQNGGETLADFLKYMDQQASGDDRMSAKLLGENENLLRIMTMHKSKGLEFPVVFCMQMSGKLHKAFRGELLMHPRLGIALPYVNRKLRIKRKTMANEAFRVQRELDDKAERARLLYVAMTRARERLIMIGSCKEQDRSTWNIPAGDYAVWAARSMTDWLMQGFHAQEIHNLSTSSPQAATPWKIRLWEDIQGLSVDNAVDKSRITTYLQQVLARPAEEIPDGWEREQVSAQAVPLKTSVSALTKKAVFNDPMPLSGSEEDTESKRVQEEILQPLRMSELPSRPAFLEQKQMTGAERGSLTHKALSIMPLEALRDSQDLMADVRRILHDMAEREVFTYQELMLLHMQGIAGFYRSELGQRVLKSQRVRREWAFNLVVDDNQETLLQGVIDCAFLEDGQWVLVDYKTDRINDEQAFCDRYRMQLTWYARALQRITGLPVREMWLYAISIGKAFRLEMMDV